MAFRLQRMCVSSESVFSLTALRDPCGFPSFEYVLSSTVLAGVDHANTKILNPDYDIYIWDLEAGEHFSSLYNTVQEVSAGPLLRGMSVWTELQSSLNTSRARRIALLYWLQAQELQLVYYSDPVTDTYQSPSLLYHPRLIQSRRIRTQNHHSGHCDSTSTRHQARRTG